MINKRWAINLPYYLVEVFICNLIGHKPVLDLGIEKFIPGVTICERCSASLRLVNGVWHGDLAMAEVKPNPLKDCKPNEDSDCYNCKTGH